MIPHISALIALLLMRQITGDFDPLQLLNHPFRSRELTEARSRNLRRNARAEDTPQTPYQG